MSGCIGKVRIVTYRCMEFKFAKTIGFPNIIAYDFLGLKTKGFTPIRTYNKSPFIIETNTVKQTNY